MEPINNNPDFTVMPNLGHRPEQVVPDNPLPAPPRGLRRWIYLGGGCILIMLLVILVYVWWSDSREDSDITTETQLPKVWLNQHFGAESCIDSARCGDDADPDRDGLSNYAEFREGTEPNNSDTDQDGLADGDELNVYKTDPSLKYTDRREDAIANDYNDGRNIRDGYDPLTPGRKMTDNRRQQINQDIQTYGLHEPTPTTLAANASPAAQTVTVTMADAKFNPESLTINVNDTVVWLNRDSVTRAVSVNGIQSPPLALNQTFSYTFEEGGVFNYQDPLNSSVRGTVEVK